MEYVDGFYYIEDYYLIYGRPWKSIDGVESAKVEMYTMEGEYRCGIEIPDSTSFQISVYFMCSDEKVYVLSVNGKDYTMCMQEIPLDSKFESVFSDPEKISKEDWFVYGGKFYVKTGEDVYEKSDFPEAIQAVLQEEENKDRRLKKEENRIVIESEYHFYIYDFETNHMEEYSSEYEHWDWQIYQETLYFIEKTGDDKTRLMAYDMVSGNAEQIDTSEYEPAQFDVRSDGAIGMWGTEGEGDEKWEGIDYWKGETYYCFWEDGTAVYVADKDYKDGNLGWTVLRRTALS